MSSRQLQRLRKAAGLMDIQALSGSDSEGGESSEAEEGGAGGAAVSMFDLLVGDSTEEEEEEQEQEEEAGENENEEGARDVKLQAEGGGAAPPTGESNHLQQQQSAGNNKTKKRKNKKKKKKQKNKTDAGDGGGAAQLLADEAPASDVSAAIAGESSAGVTSPALEGPDDHIIDTRYLNEEFEMEQRFGKEVVQAKRNEEMQLLRQAQQGGGRNRRRKKGRSGGGSGGGNRGRHSYFLVSNGFASMQPRAPGRLAGGFGMVKDRDEGGVAYYKFEFSKEYASVQETYLAMVGTHDPQNIANLLHRHPFHVDSLLQLGEVNLSMGRFEQAAELVKRALYVFDAVRHPAFDYSASGATRRLEFSEPTNRGFFTALARQMQFAGRKGCARTAFELAKLIHSLDPAADPMGMLLTIDYYALQAGRLDFVESLGSASDSPFHLQPPNMRFSSALAKFLGEGKRLQANEALRSALLTCPCALEALVFKCGWHEDARWKQLFRRRLYRESAQECPELQQRLAAIFAERQHSVWRDAAGVQEWLYQNAETAAIADENQVSAAELAAQTRSDLYASGSLLEVYGARLPQEFSDDQRVELPQEALNAGGGAGGGRRAPLPPPNQQVIDLAEEQNTNDLMLFLRTMMPWNVVDTSTRPPRNDPGANGGGGGGGGSGSGSGADGAPQDDD